MVYLFELPNQEWIFSTSPKVEIKAKYGYSMRVVFENGYLLQNPGDGRWPISDGYSISDGYTWDSLRVARPCSLETIEGRGYGGGHNTADRLGWEISYPRKPENAWRGLWWDSTTAGQWTGYYPSVTYVAGVDEPVEVKLPWDSLSLAIISTLVHRGLKPYPGYLARFESVLAYALQNGDGKKADTEWYEKHHDAVRDVLYTMTVWGWTNSPEYQKWSDYHGFWWQIESSLKGIKQW